MRKIKFKYTFFLLLATILTGVSSCEKMIEIDPPVDKINTAAVFSSDATATAALLGIYTRMNILNGSIGNFGQSLFPGLSANELYRVTSVAAYNEFVNNALSTTNTYINTNLWNYGYQFIFQANSIVDGLNNNHTVTTPTNNQLTGEAKFLRAYIYFYLYNLFGDVPLVNTVDYQANSVMPRISEDAIYAQIIADLTDAQNLLPVAYASPGKVRVNKWAATALLARIYLYRKDWIKAEQTSSTVINSGLYTLTQDLNKVFLGNSSEAIFQLLPPWPITASTANTYDGFNMIPNSGAVPAYAISLNLLNAFSSIDKRKINWIKSTTVNSVIYNYPYKYQVKTGTSITEYNMFLRLAEQYLIRAEALAQQNKISLAIADVDLIKSRAGIPLLINTNPAISQSALLDEIFAERQRELFIENGHRWFDLKRSGRINATMSLINTSWKPTAALYPIPFSELQRNPFLTQNPGYN